MPISTSPLPQIEMIESYLGQARKLNMNASVDQRTMKNYLRDIITHLDYKRRITIEEAFRNVTPADYLFYIARILDMIDAFKADYPNLELSTSEKQHLINTIENRIDVHFGAPIR